jgi:hypothetical protein
MKLKILAVLILTAWAVTASAQFPNNYARYTTYSNDGSGNLVVSMSVTGTALPPLPNMPGAYHVAQAATIWNGGAAQWQHGQNVCTSCNVNFNGSWNFSGLDTCLTDFAMNCDLEEIANVKCSFYGTFWAAAALDGAIELAITTTQTVNFVPPFPQTPYCSDRSSPPDYPGIPSSQNSFTTAATFCHRSGPNGGQGPWTCLPYNRSRNRPAGSKPDCTNFDKHIGGNYF